MLGAGANRKMTTKMLRRFVDTTKIPYCTTQMGKGVIDSREVIWLADLLALRHPPGLALGIAEHLHGVPSGHF